MLFIRGYRDSDKDACAHICRATLPPSLQGAPDPRVRLLAPYVWTHQFTYLSPGTCHVLVDSGDDDGDGPDSDKVVGYCIGCPDVLAMRRAYPRYVDDVLLRDNHGGVASPEHERRGFVEGARVEWMMASSGGEGEQQRTVTNPRALEQLAFRADLLLGHPVFSKPTLEQQQQERRPLSSYRAIMHIDLLPEAQGRGWGRKLIDRFVESVVQAASASATSAPPAGGGEGDKVDYGSGIWIGVSPENRKVLAFYERVGFRLVMNDDDEGVVLTLDIPSPGAVGSG